MTRYKAIGRVNALLRVRVDRGATPAEAENARKLALDLIAKYDIKAEELDELPITPEDIEAMAEVMNEALFNIFNSLANCFAAAASAFKPKDHERIDNER